MSSLLIQRPSQADESFPLADKEVRVGRQPDNELAIDEPSISRYHALISPRAEGHTVVDLGSRNGVWVNGQRAGDAPVPLRHGDEIDLGGQGVVLRYVADEAPTGEVTGFFGQVPEVESPFVPQALYEAGERWMKVLRVTPWLRLVGAAIGALAAALALAWWTIRFLAG